MNRAYQRRRGRGGLRPKLSRRAIIFSLCTVLGIFILVNVGLWVLYQNRTYPRTRIINTAIGSVPYSQLTSKVNELKLLPQNVQLKAGGQQQNVSLASLGIYKDTGRTVASAKEQRSWLPVVNLFKSPQLKAPVAVREDDLSKQAAELAKTMHKDPVDTHLEISGTKVSIAKAQNGFKINQSKLGDSVLSGLDKGKNTIAVALTTIPAKASSTNLKTEQNKLQQQINTVITFRYGSKSKQIASSDIANRWFVRSGDIYDISPDNLRNYIVSIGQEFGIHLKDINQAVADTTSAVKNHKDTTITLTKQVAVKTYKYCVAARGVDTANLATLRTKLVDTYNDPRGWGLDGLVGFEQVSSGCDYTVWLSAASQMPSFGAICDSQWSCRVGDDVVINFDRWMHASDAWNAYGGSLDDYRFMVINHETGHNLGFGHNHCGGAGQLAPVMQQQSIDLEGCKFNPWPLPSELAALKSHLGL